VDLPRFLRLKGSAPSVIDEAAYELISIELALNQVKQGLWTKALADSEWNESKAKSYYVRMRHEQLVLAVNQPANTQKSVDIEEQSDDARDYGLTTEDIQYLIKPIKAIKYIEKYNKTKEQVSQAISRKQLPAVIKNEVLWVSDTKI